MDLANLIKPVLTEGEIRLVGSTTFEEFKHVEKDRALARRVQKITLNEPTLEETVKILRGLRSRYEDHHQVSYTDAALEAAARLARRHLRDHRLPDSAIDVLDEAGAMLRLQATSPDEQTDGGRAGDRAASWRAWRASPRSRPPPPTRSGCARWRRRCSAWCSARRRPSTPRPWPSSARAPASAIPTIPRAASCSRAPPASARPSWPSSSRSTSATSSSATT